MASTLDIPIFPLDTVLFPGGRLPLRIFEVRYVDMTKACLRDESGFGVCQILDGREAGTPALFAPLGCTARITEWDVPAAGLFSLVTQGERVFKVREQRVERSGLIRAQVEFVEAAAPAALPAGREPLGRMLGEIIEKVGAQHFAQPARLDDAAWVAYRLAEILPLTRDQKLRLLAERDPLVLLGEVEKAIMKLES